MRGKIDGQQVMMFAVSLEELVPSDHPIRAIRRLVDRELARLDGLFETIYSRDGRPSIPPERLLKACLLMALFSVRSERQLCEQLSYNFLFRWFLDMNAGERPFDPSVFAKNKDRLLKADAVRRFFEGVVAGARGEGLLSAEHFTVDGTLIEAWASLKSFQKRSDGNGGDNGDDGPGSDSAAAGRNAEVNFKGEKRRNDTHQSLTDPEAKLYRKGNGKEAKLCFGAHVLMENRNGLCVDIQVTAATGTCEREAAVDMLESARQNGVPVRSVGADKGYDTKDFVASCRELKVTPHVATKEKGSALDGRTTRHAAYKASQICRKRVECIFGWMKTVGGFRKTRYKGIARTGLWAYVTATAYNLVRMARLLTAPPARA